MKETLGIIPLNDDSSYWSVSPAGLDSPQGTSSIASGREAREIGNRKMSDWLEEKSSDTDSAGFFYVTHGELAEAASRFYNETPEKLGENLWILKKHLEDAGYLSAPDMELERRRLKDTDPVILYASDDFSRIIRSQGYKKGLLFVKFVTLALSPLSESEINECDRLIERWVVKGRYRRHLQALLRWYNRRRRLLDVRTRRSFCELMNVDDKHKLASQLLAIGARRGFNLSLRALKQLDRLLVMNGFNPGSVHALLHRESLGEKFLPLPIERNGHEATNNVCLDSHLIKNIQDSTHRTRQLLEPLMASNNFPLTAPKIRSILSSGATNPNLVMSKLLAGQDEWNVMDLEKEVAKALPEKTASIAVLLESLNDEAYSLTDEPAAELEGDTVYINKDVLSQIQTHIQ